MSESKNRKNHANFRKTPSEGGGVTCPKSAPRGPLVMSPKTIIWAPSFDQGMHINAQVTLCARSRFSIENTRSKSTKRHLTPILQSTTLDNVPVHRTGKLEHNPSSATTVTLQHRSRRRTGNYTAVVVCMRCLFFCWRKREQLFPWW